MTSFACTILIASDVLFARSSNLPQSAESYYFSFPQVRAFHFWDVTVDLLFLIFTLVWIVLPVTGRFVKVALMLLATVGFFLCWGELVWSSNMSASSIYRLHELPFRPVGNIGLIGAQIFATYLFLALPSGKITSWQSFVVKASLAVCFWFLQILVWDGFRRLTPSGA